MMRNKKILIVLFAFIFYAPVSFAQIKPTIVVVLTAPDRCPPCRQMEPEIQKLKKEGYPIEIKYIDEDPNHGYRISSIPTTIFLNNGSEVNRIAGGMSRADLLRAFKNNNVVPAQSQPIISTAPPPRPNTVGITATEISVPKNPVWIGSVTPVTLPDGSTAYYLYAPGNTDTPIIKKHTGPKSSAVIKNRPEGSYLYLYDTDALDPATGKPVKGVRWYLPPKPPRPSELPSTLPAVPGDPGYVAPSSTVPVVPPSPVVSKPVRYIYKLVSVDYIPKSGTSYEVVIERCGFDAEGKETGCEETVMTIKASISIEAKNTATRIVRELNTAQPPVVPQESVIKPLTINEHPYEYHVEIPKKNKDGSYGVTVSYCEGSQCFGPFTKTIDVSDLGPDASESRRMEAAQHRAFEKVKKEDMPEDIPSNMPSPAKPFKRTKATVTPNGTGEVPDPDDEERKELQRQLKEVKEKRAAAEKRLEILEGKK